MTIDPDVKRIARQFGVDPTLIQAVVKAEGDILKAVKCSEPSTDTREEAITILCRSAVHRMSDFVREHCDAAYVDYFASFWAPVGVKNDPTNLNGFWPKNVLDIWRAAK